MENSHWIPQENGTYLPSPDLINAIRANPERFPNAVDDIATLSGLSREQVEANLSNPALFNGYQNPLSRFTSGAARGLVTGLGIAAEKLGNLTGIETLQDAGKGAQEFAEQNINPQFDTERGLSDTLGEVAGQTAPAIGATVAAAPAGVTAGVTAGIITSTMTFEDEDNLLNLANDYVDGAIPDFLVVQPDDDPHTSFLKALSANIITEFATLGLGKGVAKVYRAWKGGNVDEATLKAIADEAGVDINSLPTATPQDAAKALDDVAAAAAKEEAALSPMEVSKARSKLAREQIAAKTAQRDLGIDLGVTVGDPKVTKAIYREILAPVQRDLDRTAKINPSLKGPRMDAFEGEVGKRYSEVAAQVADAIAQKDIARLLREVDKIDSLPHATSYGHVFKTAALKAAVYHLEDNVTAIIQAIRKNPQAQTEATWKKLSSEYLTAKGSLGAKFREMGTSSSYAMLVRKGVTFNEEFLKGLDEFEALAREDALKNGLSLFSTKAEYILAQGTELEKLGINPAKVLNQLEEMYDEFDKVREGVLASMKEVNLNKMSAEERAALTNSWLRALQDLHASAMLGQPQTALLELLSNSLNNALLPMTKHVLTRGDFRRAIREYAGYKAAFSRSFQVFKATYWKGKGILDDFDIKDGGVSGKLDYEKLASEGSYAKWLGVRLWKFAADLSLASSEATKAMRAAGVAYADGYELAIKSGLTPAKARKAAAEYVDSKFTNEGALTDVGLKLQTQADLWQQSFDTRYALGKMANVVDNLRNSSNPVVSMVARSAVPFWRTLINIAGHSMQTIQPIPASVLKQVHKTKYGQKFVKTFKFLDDMTGANGYAAQQNAIGRQRFGYLMLGTGLAATQAGLFEVTGPAGFKRYDAKQAAFQEYPGSSLIIGGKAIDLTRLLPFSAPLMLVGVINDHIREEKLRMKNGHYVNEDTNALSMLSTYGTALGILTVNLMSDVASLRGAGELMESIMELAENPKEGGAVLYKTLNNFAKQWVPGLLKTGAKNQGLVTGDWTQYEAEGFLNSILASAGFQVGWEKIDFLGKPLDDDYWRGVDPMNIRPVKLDDPVRREYANLNRAGDLGLVLGRPTDVFDKASWKTLGYSVSFFDELAGKSIPSLNDLKTVDGDNAWHRYRELVYQGRASEDITFPVGGGSGDRVPIGHITIKKGENFEDVIRRTVASRGYQGLTPDARTKVWREIFAQFKKRAKDQLSEILVVPAGVFDTEDRYGPLTNKDVSMDELKALGKETAANVQTTRGSPWEAVFSIK